MTVTFHDRASIGLRPPNTAHLTLRTAAERTTQHMGETFHHTGAGGALFHQDPFARLRGIQAYHMDHLGYGDIAYEGGFDGDGNTFGLRDGIYVGAHAGSTGNIANRLTDGIVWLEDARGITTAGLQAFRWWVNLYTWVLRRPPVVYAHRWWAEGHGGLPTACPGDDWDAVVHFVGGRF
jgi:hypothetical protein